MEPWRPGFERWWTAYRQLTTAPGPKKKAAERWARIYKAPVRNGLPVASRGMVNYLLDQLHRQQQERRQVKRADRGAFVPAWPYASTYLNREGWSETFGEPKHTPGLSDAEATEGEPTAEERAEARRISQQLFGRADFE